MPVYFIRPVDMDGPIKIGCSAIPKNRLDALMPWSPLPLEIAATVEGDFRLERRIHGLFAANHSHREWFRATAALSELIEKLAAGVPIATLIDMEAPILPLRERPKRSTEWCRRQSYQQRLWWAFQRIEPRRMCPDDASAIVHRWTRGQLPGDADIQRLEDVITNPVAHSLTYEDWRAQVRAERLAA